MGKRKGNRKQTRNCPVKSVEVQRDKKETYSDWKLEHWNVCLRVGGRNQETCFLSHTINFNILMYVKRSFPQPEYTFQLTKTN